MSRPEYRAVLPTVQDWLRSHAYLAIYLVVVVVVWGLGIGLTK